MNECYELMISSKLGPIEIFFCNKSDITWSGRGRSFFRLNIPSDRNISEKLTIFVFLYELNIPFIPFPFIESFLKAVKNSKKREIFSFYLVAFYIWRLNHGEKVMKRGLVMALFSHERG